MQQSHTMMRLEQVLSRPIRPHARLVLLALLLPLVGAFLWPVWNIHLEATQYPKGLDLFIYLYKLEGGHGGKDINEINTLNHYIGMRPITREALTDLNWMPFAMGVLGLLTLRVAAIGNVRSLVDLAALTVYVSAFAFGRFYYMLHSFGHQLDPKAPFKVEPFTPAILGKKTIANFTTFSYPKLGSYLLGVFVLGVIILTIGHLFFRKATAGGKSTSSGEYRPS